MLYAKKTIDNEFTFIILENLNDLVIYKQINEQIKAKQSVNFWFGFKSQTFRDSIRDYALHEAEADNKMAYVLATHIQYSNKSSTSLIDMCNIADGIINNIHDGMYKFLTQGHKVRINKLGGYCALKTDEDGDSLDSYQILQSINEQELYNYLIHKELNVDFKISAKTIVIENDNHIPKTLIDKYINLTGADINDLQVITSFKQKTLLFKTVDYLHFFRKGLNDYELENIVFDSTGQDLRQLKGVRDIIQSLPFRRRLNVYICTGREDRFKDLDYDKKYLNLIFIKR